MLGSRPLKKTWTATMSQPKFKKGSRAYFGEFVQVTIEEVIPPSQWVPYFTYRVTFLGGYGGSGTATVSEDELCPDSALETTTCECGCHLIYGLENCHSFWCPARKKD